MVYPNTGSILTAEGGKNQTRTGVSTNIIIEVDGNAVGAIKEISIDEDRGIVMINEVGTDGHIDSVPNKSTDISGRCQRTRFDNLRIAAAFSRDYIHVHAQRLPFNIVIKDTFAGDDPNKTLITTIKNVWIRKIGTSYRAEDFVIVENMDWVAETIFSTVGTGQAYNTIGGRPIPIIDVNQFELAADRGDRRGALDAAGLLMAIEGVVE